VSVFPHDGTTYETLLAGADHGMYRDKASRRGRVPLSRPGPADFLAPDMIAAPPLPDVAAVPDPPIQRRLA
jgi:hypothetical protein